MSDSDKTATAERERITVGLVPKASAALADAMRRTGYSKTDTVNKALAAYAFMEEATSNKQQLIVRDPDAGTEQLIKLV